jgi:hypothetical protein
MNAGMKTNETLTCHNYWCNYKTDEPLAACPKCGRPLITAQTFRLLGFVLVFLGGLLAIVGASLMIFAAPRLVGGMGIKLFVFSIFGFLFAVGLAIAASGFWQIFFGERSQSLGSVVIVLLIALLLIAGIGQIVFGGTSGAASPSFAPPKIELREPFPKPNSNSGNVEFKRIKTNANGAKNAARKAGANAR